ncbi:MAG: hypothetical protein ACRBK7_27860 [Acidimicrobiales bacterium]
MTVLAPEVDPAIRLRHSKLAAAGGVAVVDLLQGPMLQALQIEANKAYPHHVEHHQETPPADPWDRGNPNRWLRSAAGGPVLASILGSQRLAELLDDYTGILWSPLSPQGTFSYYDRPGHHLGVHRDIERCDLTCIICCGLEGDGSGSELIAYRSGVRTPLDQVRASTDLGRVISLQPGQGALILGGLVPHEVTPIVGDLRRTVAPLCFTPAR